MRLITIIILGLCSQAFELRSQGVLEGYIKTGLENNQQLIREQLATQLQYQVEREARGGFMPNVSFDASYIWAEGGRLISVPAGDLVNPAYQGLNEILGENRFPTDIENVDEQLLPNNFHETKIRLIQPLLNSSIYYNYKAQSAQYSAQRARQQAYENQLVREIKVGYYKHLSALEKLDILLDTRELLEELLRVSKKLVANDKATKEILYASQAEVNKMDSQIAAARKQVNTSRIYFNFLLSRGLNEPILVDTTMISVPQVEALAELDQQALSTRNEISQLQYGIEANRNLVKLNQGYLVPQVNLVGDVGYQGFDYTFDDQQDFWFVQVGLTWPIFKGFQNRAKIEQSIIREQQLNSDLTDLKNQISLEVAQAYYELLEAIETLNSRQAELMNAQENFRITGKKYGQGQALLVEYNEARTNYTTAQLNQSIAKYNLKMKEASLDAAVNLK